MQDCENENNSAVQFNNAKLNGVNNKQKQITEYFKKTT